MNISSRRKKGWSVALSALLIAGIALPAPQTASAAPDYSNIIISQVYGGGGNSGALYKNDFIELYNPTDSPVDLSGWKVRYAGATTSFSDDDKYVTSLSGTIPAGDYYLIQEAAGTGGTVNLPVPNEVGSIAMGGPNGKVELLNTSGTRIDLVGYGSANEYEGKGIAAPEGAAPVLSNTTAAIRKASDLLPAGNRGLDTDSNIADFTAGTPDPRSSGVDNTVAPAVKASIATGSTVPKGSALALSTGSVTASVYYSVYIDGSGTAVEDFAWYQAPLVLEADSVAIKAFSKEEGKTDSSIAQFSYTTQQALTGLTIPQIQGTAHSSTYADQLVQGIQGIVTYKNGSTFYIQTATPDSDPRTSEAIMVYLPGNSVAVGDAVQVDGRVKEYKESGYADAVDLLTTEIVAVQAVTLSKGNALPAPTIIGTGGRTIPTATISAGLTKALEPAKYALDFYESLEGMRVQLNTPKIIGPYNKYEIPVTVNNGTSTTEVSSPAGGLVLTGADFNPQRILIAKAPSTPVKTGQVFTGNITGILGYDYGNYKVRPDAALPEVSAGTSIVRETTSLKPEADKLTIASFNVENFSKTSGARIDNIAKAIVSNLQTPDIVGLLEVQDNSGGTDNGIVDAKESYTALIDAIAKAGGPVYAYTDISPENNKDGGATGGNIRAGFIYNTARVSLVPGTAGDATTAVTYTKDGGLSLNPGRIDPGNAAFSESRKPLAAEFMFNDEKVMVIANHFNSKTGDSGLYGGIQPPVRNSETQRAEIAKVVNGFVSDVLTKNPEANIVVLGDLNDFQFSNTLKVLKGSALTNLIDTLPLGERYSYVYEGNSQTLDHMLVNNALASQSKLDIVHINADFMEEDGRVSDHDPLLTQIDFGTDNFNLRVLHTNDTHAHLENITKRTSAISSERTGNTILLDAGDVFSGTLYFNQFKGQADLEFMNLIGYDAMTFGNHEFDMNKEQPEVLKDFITAAQFPFISSNIDFTTKKSELAELYHDTVGTLATSESASTAKDGNIYPAVIKDVYGEKVGIFALTTEDTVGLASPGDKIIFNNYVESAKKAVKLLEDQGINKIIALTHLGYTVDLELAKAVPGIDIIVGGHSHTKLDTPTTAAVNGNGDPVLIVQTGEYSLFLGELDVTFDKDGDILSYNGKLLDVGLFGEDQAAKKLLAPYDAKLATVRSTVVGHTSVDLYTNRLINGDSVRVVRQEETPIGNLIADSIADKVRELMPNFVSAEDLKTIKGVVAIQNGGGIRAAIDPGDITMGEVLTTLPFGNSLVALKVTGEEIISSLENSVSGLSSDQGRFAQVSGMRYTFDSTKTPEIVDSASGKVTQAGERIISVDILQADGSYAPIDPKAYYLLSTNSFMAGGGDFYRALAAAKADGRYYELGLPDFEVLLSYLKKHESVEAKLEGRITDLKGTAPEEEDFSLRILHTNDTHSHLETVVKRMTAIKQERTPNSLLIDAGDVFSGTLYFTKFEGLADLNFMNYIGYDVMTFGNHEFDKGLGTLKKFMDQAEFPFVSSNIDFTTKDNELKANYKDEIGGLGGTEVLNGHIYPSVVKEVYGEPIGIFGLTTEDTVGLSSPGDKISFQNYKASAEATVAALKAEGINKIIAVSHLGYNVDLQLAAEVPGIDVIVGGHSHTKLDTPVMVNKESEPTLIVQTGEYGQNLGELDVEFDDEGVITDYSGKLLDVTKFADDAQAKEMLAGYDKDLAEIRQTVVGKTDVPLVYERVIDGKATRVVRKEETNLGNLVADGINAKAKELVSGLIPAAELSTIKGFVAIQNGGGIRAGIDQGDITLGEVLGVMPFSNSLVALKVTGQEIIDALENSVSGLETDQGRFAQVSGMRYTYDSTKPAEIINPTSNVVEQNGQRIVSVEIKQANGSYTAVDPNGYYILSTNSFMAGGGDFYRSLAAAKADGRFYELYLPDYEVFTDHLKAVGTVNIGTEGRITDLKGAAPTPTPTPAPGGTGGTNPTPTPSASATPAPSAAPQVTTITPADLTAKLAALPSGTSELVIPVTATAGGAQVVLPGSALLQQAAANPATVLTFTTGTATYSLPLSALNASALTAQLGSGDFTVTVSVLTASAAAQSSVSQAAAAGSVTVAAPVIEFTVTASSGSTSVPLNSFGSTYVKRSITAPSALNPDHATAVSYDPATGKLSFVPSVFTAKADGTTEVTILRNSNSLYTVVTSSKTFGDTGGHWAQSAIELLASKLIVTGTSATAFSPSQNVTRAEFAALITRSLGLAPISSGTAFSDVSANAWYAEAVQTAAAAGLITGYTDGSFKPASPITRQEIAVVLSKAMKYTGKALNADAAALAKFSDAASIPAWSQAAIGEIAAEGIIQGRPDGTFAPQLLATRAEAVTMLEKALKSLQFID
ncbi:5'-nucleotidase C-terminal domain-containing protein [Paenibacillus tepidiphilus]|uniref:5'-nucleotidase C-terminal domain-containing protein n=1 Tax=Paenibacillus tepidiphilus TaxID=2608683 RepID=UPI0013A59406|nr:5'-nucleotidase C-terminal domain-containing protein [Paenibacillus tepidiphilus]